MSRRFLLVGLTLVGTINVSLRAQPVQSKAWADSVFATLRDRKVVDHEGTLGLTGRMIAAYTAAGDTCMMARIASLRGDCFDGLGQLDSAMAAIQRGLRWFQPRCDSLTLMSLYANLSSLYLSLEEYDRVDSICTFALAIWNPRWAYSKARNSMLTNRAIAHAYSGDMDKALDAFRMTLHFARKEKNDENEFDALNNVGALFGMLARSQGSEAYFDSTEQYQYQALQLARRLGNQRNMSMAFSNLAAIAGDRKRPREGLAWLDSAKVLADATGDLSMATIIEHDKSMYLQQLGLPDSAFAHLKLHLVLKDSLLNTEKVRAIADVREKYETEKKARENEQLRAENLAVELQKARVTRTRNIYLFTGIAVVLVAGGLWSRLQYTRRSRAAIQKEKDVSEGLLLNILPAEVAAELKQKGYTDARQFEQATILFTDFKGFTQMSEKLTAHELVAEIDHCFKAFDAIMSRHRIEKIKTIGDAYMAAGGLPDPAHGSPSDVLQAALEMQEFMMGYKSDREGQGRLFFEMRVGIHTGPVIAGIVGVKKFAYDIWGDTVNTASRMESSGEVGRVNISETTYELVKDHPKFTFEPRGKVQAKGKGEITMYFAARAAT